jgi:lactoylglutathione lyase
MLANLQAIEVITLFVQDLHRARSFYTKVFGAEVVMEDPDSAILKFGPLMINLLVEREAGPLIDPLSVGRAVGGARFMFTVKVDDVDSVIDELASVGVDLLNGPIDRPWGRRTAAFSDPDGHVWEVAADLPTA